MDSLFHPTATVSPEAAIGSRTRIWHYAHVMGGAQIGADCMIGHGCFVGDGARIADRVRIQNHVSIFSGVTLEADVFVGPSCVFTNVKYPRAELNRKASLASTTVERGATLGANATIIAPRRIGRYALVGAGAVVTADVPAFSMVVGAPARHAGWVGRHGVPLVRDASPGLWRCPESGLRYEEQLGALTSLDLADDAPIMGGREPSA